MNPLDTPISPVQTIRERILQRRRQMCVHSFIYYQLDDNLVSDDTWQQWANELRDLQGLFGWEVGYHDAAFQDWTGASGFKLPKDDRVVQAARRLLRTRDSTRA